MLILLAGCASGPTVMEGDTAGKTVCDSYIVLHMCVRDYTGDGVVDMIYFSDTYEIFMYRVGMKNIVAAAMPFHQCVVPLSAAMQDISNRILFREGLSFGEELEIKKDLLFAYLAAKPEIDVCNKSFEVKNSGEEQQSEEFFIEESEWDD
ncbi:MAG: hypothetical protein IMF06_09915 [Proteobacteria bacterium]|nr:hypothetical protein [Pseudomonadota bacterium]